MLIQRHEEAPAAERNARAEMAYSRAYLLMQTLLDLFFVWMVLCYVRKQMPLLDPFTVLWYWKMLVCDAIIRLTLFPPLARRFNYPTITEIGVFRLAVEVHRTHQKIVHLGQNGREREKRRALEVKFFQVCCFIFPLVLSASLLHASLVLGSVLLVNGFEVCALVAASFIVAGYIQLATLLVLTINHEDLVPTDEELNRFMEQFPDEWLKFLRLVETSR